MGKVADVVLTGALTYKIGAKRFYQYKNERVDDRALIETLSTNKNFSVRIIEDTPDAPAPAVVLDELDMDAPAPAPPPPPKEEKRSGRGR